MRGDQTFVLRRAESHWISLERCLCKVARSSRQFMNGKEKKYYDSERILIRWFERGSWRSTTPPSTRSPCHPAGSHAFRPRFTNQLGRRDGNGVPRHCRKASGEMKSSYWQSAALASGERAWANQFASLIKLTAEDYLSPKKGDDLSCLIVLFSNCGSS